MHDWYSLSLDRVNNYVAIHDWCLLVQEEYVSALHGRFHTSAENDHYGGLGPESKLEAVPDHHSGNHNDAELGCLVSDLPRDG